MSLAGGYWSTLCANLDVCESGRMVFWYGESVVFFSLLDEGQSGVEKRGGCGDLERIIGLKEGKKGEMWGQNRGKGQIGLC